jgi:hypothetical protein
LAQHAVAQPDADPKEQERIGNPVRRDVVGMAAAAGLTAQPRELAVGSVQHRRHREQGRAQVQPRRAADGKRRRRGQAASQTAGGQMVGRDRRLRQWPDKQPDGAVCPRVVADRASSPFSRNRGNNLSHFRNAA